MVILIGSPMTPICEEEWDHFELTLFHRSSQASAAYLFCHVENKTLSNALHEEDV